MPLLLITTDAFLSERAEDKILDAELSTETASEVTENCLLAPGNNVDVMDSRSVHGCCKEVSGLLFSWMEHRSLSKDICCPH